MRRSLRIRIVVLGLLALLGSAPTRAQSPKAFDADRATVARIEPGPTDAARLEAYVRAGANTIVVPTDSNGTVPSGLAERIAALGLSLLLEAAPDSAGRLTLRAPGEASFMVDSAPIENWPESFVALASLYAERARSPQRPESAPLALSGSREEDASWYLLPGPIEVTGAPRAGAAALAAEFRANHPAVAAGIHETLQAEPFAFHRALRLPGGAVDRVVVVMGAQERVRLNVAALFANDTVLRDTVTGRIALVTFGQLAFTPDPSGLALFEEAK